MKRASLVALIFICTIAACLLAQQPIPGAGTAVAGIINLVTSVSGILPLANGGTGIATATGTTGTGNIVLSAAPTLTGTISINSIISDSNNGSSFRFVGNGQPQFRNNGGTGFDQLILGPQTSSGYALVITTGTNPVLALKDASGADTAVLSIGAIKSTTGQRFVCITTTGALVSSASACSGT